MLFLIEFVGNKFSFYSGDGSKLLYSTANSPKFIYTRRNVHLNHLGGLNSKYYIYFKSNSNRSLIEYITYYNYYYTFFNNFLWFGFRFVCSYSILYFSDMLRLKQYCHAFRGIC